MDTIKGNKTRNIICTIIRKRIRVSIALFFHVEMVNLCVFILSWSSSDSEILERKVSKNNEEQKTG